MLHMSFSRVRVSWIVLLCVACREAQLHAQQQQSTHCTSLRRTGLRSRILLFHMESTSRRMVSPDINHRAAAVTTMMNIENGDEVLSMTIVEDRRLQNPSPTVTDAPGSNDTSTDTQGNSSNPNVNNGASNTNNNSSSNASQENNGQDAYEFIAFLLWYIFLVLCCVVPTCCAYRRRRLVEARLAQQQANMSRFQQSNLFILSNLHHTRRNSERIRVERTRILNEELKQTTMTIQKDLQRDVESSITPTSRINLIAKAPDIPGEVSLAAAGGGESSTAAADCTTSAKPRVEAQESLDLDDFNEPFVRISLPSGAVNGDRTISGVCSICLCAYQEGDQISWSPETACQHAFHTSCIIPWLAKKDEPKCPICRQDFCQPVLLENEPPSGTMQFHPSSSGEGNNRETETELVPITDSAADRFLESFTQALSRLELNLAMQSMTSPSVYQEQNRRLPSHQQQQSEQTQDASVIVSTADLNADSANVAAAATTNTTPVPTAVTTPSVSVVTSDAPGLTASTNAAASSADNANMTVSLPAEPSTTSSP